jgi:predicted nuclease of predicted toxin-antitoxin system
VTIVRPVLRLFLDEGVPDSVGHAFMEAGHQVAFLNKTIARGSSDHLVCVIADINQAILVALDGDMKRIAQGYGIGGRKFLKLGLIKLSCFEPDAASRVRTAMSLIEHEWMCSTPGQEARRLFVEIGDSVIRSFR